MAGHTEIGRKAYLGIGCTIIDDIRVGAETIVGAGAVVIRDIPDHAVVAGVPAKASPGLPYSGKPFTASSQSLVKNTSFP